MNKHLRGGIAPVILNLGIRLDEKSTSRPGCFTSDERVSGTYWMRGALPSQSGRWGRGIYCCCRESNEDFSVVKPI